MERIEVSKGIWLNVYSDRLAVMTSSYNKGWRVVYLGYETWQDACKCVAYMSKAERTTKREARKAERLDQCSFEVKCWGVSDSGLNALIKRFASPQPTEAKLPEAIPAGVTVILTRHYSNDQLIVVHVRKESTKISEPTTPIPVGHKAACIEGWKKIGCKIVDRTERHLALVS